MLRAKTRLPDVQNVLSSSYFPSLLYSLSLFPLSPPPTSPGVSFCLSFPFQYFLSSFLFPLTLSRRSFSNRLPSVCTFSHFHDLCVHYHFCFIISQFLLSEPILLLLPFCSYDLCPSVSLFPFFSDALFSFLCAFSLCTGTSFILPLDPRHPLQPLLCLMTS